MERKGNFNFDNEALEALKVGECLEGEITFPGDDEPMKMKVCKTKYGLKPEDTRWEKGWQEYQRKIKEP